MPQDISVVGFDDIELAEFYVPRLTTIRQNRRQLGITAAQRVLANLRGESYADLPLECIIDVDLVVRDDCSPLPNMSIPQNIKKVVFGGEPTTKTTV